MHNVFFILLLGATLIAAPKFAVKKPLTEEKCRAKKNKKARAKCLEQLAKQPSALPAAPAALASLDGGATLQAPAPHPAAPPRSAPVELLPFQGEPANCLDSRRIVWRGFIDCMNEKKYDMLWLGLPVHPVRKAGMETSEACVAFANANADALYKLGYDQCEALKGADQPPRAPTDPDDHK